MYSTYKNIYMKQKTLNYSYEMNNFKNASTVVTFFYMLVLFHSYNFSHTFSHLFLIFMQQRFYDTDLSIT